jgi:4-hydroxy-tetrahydrodipicolinate synthase
MALLRRRRFFGSDSVSISGLIVPIVTPMDEDCTIDFFGLKNHISKLLNVGAKNFFVGSAIGESKFLSQDDEAKLIEDVISIVGSKGFVIAGCCADSAELAVQKVRSAERAGAYACAVNVPLTALTNEVFFMDFFDELLTNTRGNIFLYNDPFVFKRNIPILGLNKLVNWERVIGIIDFSNNQPYFKELCNLQGMKIFQGNDSLAFDSLRANCSGLASPASNVLPQLFLNLLKNFRELDTVASVRQQGEINSFIENYFTSQKKIQAYKYALSLKGIMKECHSKQLEPLTQKEKDKIDECVKQFA